MSLIFSAVTVKSEEDSVEFFIGGIPRNCDDLMESQLFEDFVEWLDEEQELTIHVEAYNYGSGEAVYADADEAEALEKKADTDYRFLSDQCDSIEEVDFSFVWSPDELYGMEME